MNELSDVQAKGSEIMNRIILFEDEPLMMIKRKRVSLLSALLPGFLGLIAAVITFYLTLSMSDKAQKNLVNKTFNEAIKQELLEKDLEIKDVKLLYEAATGLPPKAQNFIEGIHKSLISLNLELSLSGHKEKNNDIQLRLKRVISKLGDKGPFYGLPEKEQGIFKEIYSLLPVNNQMLKQKFEQLATLSLYRTEELADIRSNSRWAFIIAIGGSIGTFLSLIFQLLQYFSRFYKIDSKE